MRHIALPLLALSAACRPTIDASVADITVLDATFSQTGDAARFDLTFTSIDCSPLANLKDATFAGVFPAETDSGGTSMNSVGCYQCSESAHLIFEDIPSTEDDLTLTIPGLTDFTVTYTNPNLTTPDCPVQNCTTTVEDTQ